MRQSIITKYHGPGNVLGSRVSATSSSGHRIIIDWDDALNTDENHAAAARKLAEKLQWHGTWQAGSLPTGCVYVNLDGDTFTIDQVTA